MKKKLTIGSFKREGYMGSFGHRFFTKLEDGREVDLESCLSGYDVAIYDKDLNLIGEKTCTKTEGMEFQIMPGFSIGTGEPKQSNVGNISDFLKAKAEARGEKYIADVEPKQSECSCVKHCWTNARARKTFCACKHGVELLDEIGEE